MLLVQATRPERLYAAMQRFVLSALDVTSVNPPPFSLLDIFNESRSEEPILLLLAGAVDPTQELESLAGDRRQLWKSISMGQGQEAAAVEAIRQGKEDGGWVCLGNIHLALHVVPLIEKVFFLLIIQKYFLGTGDYGRKQFLPSLVDK